MMRYPAGEQITVPPHVQTDNVRTTINVASFGGSDRGGALLTALGKPLSLAMRTPLRQAFAARSKPAARRPERRVAPRRPLQDRLHRPLEGGRAAGDDDRSDVYGLTAASIARGGIIAASRGFSGLGALAPAQAFDRAASSPGSIASTSLEPRSDGQPKPEHAEATA